jgi:hypothetical protein
VIDITSFAAAMSYTATHMAYIGHHERQTFWLRHGDKIAFSSFFGTAVVAISNLVYDMSAKIAASNLSHIDIAPDHAPQLGTMAAIGIVGSLGVLATRRRTVERDIPALFVRPPEEPVPSPLATAHTVVLQVVYDTRTRAAAPHPTAVLQTYGTDGSRVPIVAGASLLTDSRK